MITKTFSRVALVILFLTYVVRGSWSEQRFIIVDYVFVNPVGNVSCVDGQGGEDVGRLPLQRRVVAVGF